jgi:hypothetical protein
LAQLILVASLGKAGVFRPRAAAARQISAAFPPHSGFPERLEIAAIPKSPARWETMIAQFHESAMQHRRPWASRSSMSALYGRISFSRVGRSQGEFRNDRGVRRLDGAGRFATVASKALGMVSISSGAKPEPGPAALVPEHRDRRTANEMDTCLGGVAGHMAGHGKAGVVAGWLSAIMRPTSASRTTPRLRRQTRNDSPLGLGPGHLSWKSDRLRPRQSAEVQDGNSGRPPAMGGWSLRNI